MEITVYMNVGVFLIVYDSLCILGEFWYSFTKI